ncbi:hypothetical protein H6F42_18035 [Pseudanabaena sp. FACHB-1998]|uniref:hypothetical protein n=1 Tax=Pseudanabaena sp. FACHB-1998 TaxID=2692858 RepID=UPI001680788A|nr:hypothetical protein [Pseudanabaena sp. FACHB-1998]MBD2178823.1 hypothetical protein [Pseudanabaena sp. FACHB-1998]
MPKFSIYIGIAAIAGLFMGCQPTPSPSPTPTAANKVINNKAIDYLRSQLSLSPSLAIVAESQKSQAANINDLCQTATPTQEGWEIALVAEDTRYILQTNQDASKIEICRSEDAQPATTGKYTGAGYLLRYPATWKAIDLGLEPSGASAVIFTPSPELNLTGENNLEKLRQQLYQSQQAYALVLRQPIGGKAIAASDDSSQAKDVVTVPFDAKVKGAKSGSKKEFTIAIANTSPNDSSEAIPWQVKVLTLETDRFIYTVSYYQPKSSIAANSSAKIFEQFANSFALVQSP